MRWTGLPPAPLAGEVDRCLATRRRRRQNPKQKRPGPATGASSVALSPFLKSPGSCAACATATGA
ncbi:MAG: hypothetical protein B7Z12_09880 [Caulobacter vibrioides]|uniref:Uncharacterized protein n=1 Tax=Caulobacter vibrioides TaxID=155892 RepID=A0A258D855_CAUVI|nr:MAG: hypothetical protein B7Z12_09880 [Caulobacter vibrioides]